VPTPPSQPQPDLDRKLVLVVDDDASVRTLVVRALQAKGYAVEQAKDGLAASEMLGALSRLPDLIICDLMMPTIDGMSLARFVRKRAELRAIPIIFLTARTDADAIVDAINLGVRHYVQKPFSVQDLLSKVERSLR
jgi:DNA-binding response OmpR family regulator